jgi:hypothetical protein
MKNLRMFAVFALVAMSLFAVTAEAQEISVFFGTEMASSKQVKMFDAFDISIVVSNINDTIGAVEYTLNLPANVVITASNYWNGTNLVLDGIDGTAIALGECVTMVDAPGLDQEITVASFEAIAVNVFASSDVTLTEYNSIVNPASAPRYANCQDQLIELTPVNGTLEGVTVPTEATSFSKVKALF